MRNNGGCIGNLHNNQLSSGGDLGSNIILQSMCEVDNEGGRP